MRLSTLLRWPQSHIPPGPLHGESFILAQVTQMKLAYWGHPAFSPGPHPLQPLWGRVLSSSFLQPSLPSPCLVPQPHPLKLQPPF